MASLSPFALLKSFFFASLLTIGSCEIGGIAPLTFPDNTPPAGVDVWCGKAYRATDAAFSDLVDRGWLHPPPRSDTPLLEFSCRPRLRPYIRGRDHNRAYILVTARVSHDVGFPFPDARIAKDLHLAIRAGNDTPLASTVIRPSLEPTEIEVDLTDLPTGQHILYCAASLSHHDKTPLATATSPLSFLPPNPHLRASTVQLDQLTSQLHVSDLAPKSKLPKSFYPIGYYTSWSNYLLPLNSSRLAQIKADGFTIVHPIPGGGPASDAWGSDGFATFRKFLDLCEAAGLWVMYDLRHTFSKPTELRLQVEAFRDHPALLLWYTADEPDGHNNPTNSTVIAYDAVNALDGYHPVSMTPNCGNYFWRQYTAGADIVVPDVYPVAVDLTFSNVYHTPCNRTYGCCGCDNCTPVPNHLQGLANRIEEMREYARLGGTWKAFWGVSQSFGGSEFWTRPPNRQEAVEMSVAAVKSGASGMLYWVAPAEEVVYGATKEVASWVNGKGPELGDGDGDGEGEGEGEGGGGEMKLRIKRGMHSEL